MCAWHAARPPAQRATHRLEEAGAQRCELRFARAALHRRQRRLDAGAVGSHLRRGMRRQQRQRRAHQAAQTHACAWHCLRLERNASVSTGALPGGPRDAMASEGKRGVPLVVRRTTVRRGACCRSRISEGLLARWLRRSGCVRGVRAQQLGRVRAPAAQAPPAAHPYSTRALCTPHAHVAAAAAAPRRRDVRTQCRAAAAGARPRRSQRCRERRVALFFRLRHVKQGLRDFAPCYAPLSARGRGVQVAAASAARAARNRSAAAHGRRGRAGRRGVFVVQASGGSHARSFRRR